MFSVLLRLEDKDEKSQITLAEKVVFVKCFLLIQHIFENVSFDIIKYYPR